MKECLVSLILFRQKSVSSNSTTKNISILSIEFVSQPNYSVNGEE